MDNKIFEKLLSQSENETLDFKLEQYRIFKSQCDTIKKSQKYEFIKDIICMANTPRNTSAYIIVGVKENSKTLVKDFVGCSEVLEDSNIQEILKNEIYPMVSMEYYSFEYTGDKYPKNMYQIYEIKPIKVGRAYYPKNKREGFLNPDTLYCRSGSRNSEADEEGKMRIEHWCKSIKESYEVADYTNAEIEKLKSICNNFDRSSTYVLLIDRIESGVETDLVKYISNIKWNLIIDFDRKSKIDGFYNIVYPSLSKNQSVKQLIGNEKIVEEYSGKDIVRWYPINGLEPYDEYYNIDDSAEVRQWKRKNITNMRKMIENMWRHDSIQNVKVIICLDNLSNKKFILEEIDQIYMDNAEYIVISKDDSSNMFEEYDVASIKLNKSEFLEGIKNINSTVLSDEVNEIRLPRYIKSTSDKSSCSIPLREYRWLEEELVIVHLGIINLDGEISKDKYSFYKGNKITWEELDIHCDIDRSITSEVEDRILIDLYSEKTTTVNLFYIPGAGATTIARRIAWNVHTKYPTVIVKSISKSTIEKFVYLAEKTSTPIFAVIDGNVAKSEQIENLYGEILARLKNVVLLRVDRVKDEKIRKRDINSERTFYLNSALDRDEFKKFMLKYTTEYSNIKGEFEKINQLDTRFKTPFYFGFVAYKEEFIFIPKYVEDRINGLSDIQKKIISFITVVYYFSHKLTPANFFKEILSVPKGKNVELAVILNQRILELFTFEGDREWRPIHSIIAEEILDKLHNSQNGKKIWPQKLSDWGCGIVDICKNMKYGEFYHSDALDILIALFIDRRAENIIEEDVDKNRFSNFIESIPSKEGKLNVFEYLTKNIKNQIHFIAHKARLHLYMFDDIDNAFKCINEAIELDSNDANLHHIKGTIISKALEKQIDSLKLNKEADSLENNSTLTQIYEDAIEEFNESRKLESENIYAYTSHILLNLKVVEFGYNVYSKKNQSLSKSNFMSNKKSRWYAEILQDAEKLIYQAKKLKFSSKSEGFIKNYENKIDEYYKEYSEIIQNWTNLLKDNSIYAPSVRRQIIRAYFSKSNGNWQNANERELSKVLELIEDNINQEPENVYNISRWFEIYRHLGNSNINKAIEKFKIWDANNPSIESAYYIYILKTLQLLQSSTTSNLKNEAEEIIKICKDRAINMKNRTYSYEWYGEENGLNALIHHSRIDLEKTKENDFENLKIQLKEVNGRIEKINSPANGVIKLDNGLKVFFLPMQSDTYKDKDEGKEIKCYISFSYDGIRAWKVKKLG